MTALSLDSDLEILPMTEAHLPRVMKIENAAHVHPWTKGIMQDCIRVGYLCRVVTQNSEVIGFYVLSMGAGEAHILNICVSPDKQRQGIGQLLLQHLIKATSDHPVDNLLLEVRPSNISALNLYQKTGFNEVGIRRNYYPSESGREDAIILAMKIFHEES